jgi:hypothetical protein
MSLQLAREERRRLPKEWLSKTDFQRLSPRLTAQIRLFVLAAETVC